MTRRTRWIWSGFVVAALGLMLVGSRGFADRGDDIKKDVQKIADALKKGDEAAAKTLTDKLMKDYEEGLYEAMLTMKPASSKQMGFPTPGLEPEGIEKFLQEVAAKGLKPDDVKKNKDALLELGYRVQAIAHVAQSFKQKKMKAQWDNYAKTMNEVSKDLIQAVQKGNADDVNKVASKLDANCNQCHEKFR